ncbi:DUF3392 domain-containing protein [Alteromonas sp. ASW11-19]|uniref:DUF3392 domain-containing protein n=1 Tax=Alteromonas salexigens TaxID=2982530 RepID=A0ABT2VNH1_9ALTE|nr:DUF3392 domain-containing protein [Alteromonas salexigens]MCU7554649.1 DUF3392 domain-containing protein [Alteromonas salexigens]
MIAVLGQLSQWLSQYYSELSLMLMATILVVYGDVINKHVKRVVSSWHFTLRTLAFVLLCAFGYGFMTLYGAPFVLHIIKYLPWHLQGIGFIAAFVLIGALAERRRYI